VLRNKVINNQLNRALLVLFTLVVICRVGWILSMNICVSLGPPVYWVGQYTGSVYWSTVYGVMNPLNLINSISVASRPFWLCWPWFYIHTLRTLCYCLHNVVFVIIYFLVLLHLRCITYISIVHSFIIVTVYPKGI
jgi:hypothetical protein